MLQLSTEQQRELELELSYVLSRTDIAVAGGDFSKYRTNPASFIEEILGETLTDDLREVCDSVARYPVTIAQSGNGTGKSWLVARLVLWFYLCCVEPQVYSAAAPPESNLRNIVWAEINSLIHKRPDLFEHSRVTDMRIERTPREFATGVTIPTAGNEETKQARFSGKHAPSLMFTVDEADAVPDAVFNGIETCLSGGFDRLICTFNPRQRQGAVWRMIRDGRANVVKLTAFTHPNVITGKDVIPGAVDREKTLRRIAQWTRPLAPGEVADSRCFVLPEYLENQTPHDQKGEPLTPLVPGYYRIINHQFSHVVLGEYPAQSDRQLISQEWIDAARARYDLYTSKFGEQPPDGIKAVVGIDVAEHGPDLAVMSERYGTLLLPLAKWEGKTDPIEVGDNAIQALHGRNVGTVKVEGIGVGSGTAPYMAKKGYPAVTVKVSDSSGKEAKLGDEVIGTFARVRDELLWKLREWLRTDLAMLPPDPYLEEELLVLEYWEENGRIRITPTDKIKETLQRSPDSLMAVMVGFHSSGMFQGVDLS